MEKSKTLEAFGTMIKTEKLYQLDDIVLDNTLVYEAQRPFCGYYHDTPTKIKPLYIYLVLAKNYGWEEILRASQDVFENTTLKFEAAKSHITYKNTHYVSIRIRKIVGYNLIKSIQEAFISSGIELLSTKLKKQEYEATIKMIKIFHLNSLNNGIYLDGREDSMGYFEIPKHINLEDFKKLSQQVHYNWTNAGFDATICSSYIKTKLRELIRIYSHNMNEKYLEECKASFLKQISME